MSPADPSIPVLYAASVNPPRRAKRSLHPTTLSADNPKTPRTLLPGPASVSSARNNDTVDTIDVVAEQVSAATLPPAPKKRGRKPLGGSSAPSRAARESARRANHSRIEKARRLKINGALETLRELVPAEPELGDNAQEHLSGLGPTAAKTGLVDPCDADVDVDEDVTTEWVNWKDGHEDSSGMTGKSSNGATAGGNARAFKLDVLERTVVYVRVLLDRIRQLEAQLDATDADAARACTCGAFSRVKRKSKAIVNRESESNLLGELKRRKLSVSTKISSGRSYDGLTHSSPTAEEDGDDFDEDRDEGDPEDGDYHDHSDSDDHDDTGVIHPTSSSSPAVAYQDAVTTRASHAHGGNTVESSNLSRRPHLPSIATLLAEPLTEPALGYAYSAARTERLSPSLQPQHHAHASPYYRNFGRDRGHVQIPASPSVSPHLPPTTSGSARTPAQPPSSTFDIVNDNNRTDERIESVLSAIPSTSAGPDNGLKPGPNDNLLLTPPSSDRARPREMGAAIVHALDVAPLKLPLSAITAPSPTFSGDVHRDDDGSSSGVTETKGGKKWILPIGEKSKGDDEEGRQGDVRREHEQRQGYDPLEGKGSLPIVEAHANIAEESCHEVAASLVLLRTRGGTVTTSQEASSTTRLNTSTGAIAVTVATSTPPQTPGGLLGLKVAPPVSLSTTTGPASASISQ